MDRHNQSLQRGRSVSAANAAQANEYFEHFLNANTLKSILGYYRSICDLVHLKPNVFPLFYPKLRANLTSWRAKALWKKFDARASHKCYMKGKACPNTRVLIIGAGPCGLRSAIEAQLLGAKVVVVEKRDRISRNNVLHLWPFVIEDLRALGAKKFFGKFCAGAIDHISIRMLQCILLKVALLLGVEVHTEVSFEGLIEPNLDTKTGWRADFKPQNHPVSQYEFDVIIGADGKRNTLQGFKRKEFRGKLAIAITANFINRRTEAEARVEEISGVAFIFNQKFFKELYADTGIDLENIVYYKDDTHYFVMTAKKASLIDKGVIKQDLADTEQLLAPGNVDRDALMSYAREAAEFSTNYQMPNLEFAVNHYAQPDVAMFDFTSMYAADNASKVVERNGYRLLMILVGDSLLEPFWPTGSGCARGFLSSLDAAWAIRAWASETVTPLDVLAERESIYRLLAQTTPDNLNKEWKAYTLDPATRYPNLNRNAVIAHQVVNLFDTDNPKSIEHMKRTSQEAAQSVGPKRRRRDVVDNEVLLRWVEAQIKEHDDLEVTDIASVFRDGRILCAILSHYRPDLLDYSALEKNEPTKNNQTAIDLLEKEIGLSPLMTGEEMTRTDDLLSLSLYLTEVYHTFRCEIPHINHPKLVSEAKLSSTKQDEKIKTINSNPSQNNSLPRPSLNELLLTKSMLKPVAQNESQKVENTKTPFDYWLNQNEVAQDAGAENSRRSESTSCDKLKKELKFYDENFREVSPDDLQANVINATGTTTTTTTTSSALTTIQETTERESNVSVLATSSSSASLNSSSTVFIKDSNQEVNQNVNVTPESKSTDAHSCDIKIRMIKQDSYNKQLTQTLSFNFQQNELYVFPKQRSQIKEHYVPKCLREGKYQAGGPLLSRNTCHTSSNLPFLNVHQFKFLFKANMSDHHLSVPPEQIYERVVDWLNSSGDTAEKSEIDNAKYTLLENEFETNIPGNLSDISSITKVLNKERLRREEFMNLMEGDEVPRKVSENTVLTQDSSDARLQTFVEKLRNNAMVKGLKKITNLSALQLYRIRMSINSKTPSIPAILEKDEVELPEEKRTESAFSKQMYAHMFKKPASSAPAAQPPRPSSRHKRHADTMAPSKPPSSLERKPRKRRTLERVGASVEDRQKRLEEIASNRSDRQNKRRQHRKFQTEQFIKSMQMLQANAKSDQSGPFEDYSIFLYRQTAPNFEDRVKDLEKQFIYIPDSETRLPAHTRGEKDEDFAARIKDMEDKWREPVVTEKKPKDLLRAIGKIETSDWNIKEIEKKINENKMGKSVNKDKEKVPKWSREQFLARQTKMEKQHLDRQNSAEAKFADIDKSIKQLELKLKEGTSRDLGQNKVASITEKLAPKGAEGESKPVQRSNSRTFVPAGGSEMCHFCSKRVYLMERLSAEGRFFHHGCFRCQYCHTQLRLGSYAFDKDGQYGHKFFCVHHYGMQGELRPATKVIRKVTSRAPRETKSPEKKLTGVAGVDLLDRVQTPERIEFANLSTGNISSEHDEPPSQMDEDEWTDRNFGASAAELGSSEDESSSLSDTDSDDEDAYEEALEEPATKEGTLKWAERLSRRYRRKNSNDSDSDDYSSSEHSSYYENSSEDDDSDTATEGEEEIRARELRKQEVRVEPPVVHTDTGTDTEVVSDESSSESSSEIQNSATEISTDSEFAHDDPTPTREIPSIVFNDFHVTKTRGTYGAPKKIQVTSGYLQSPIGGKRPQKQQDIELKLKPLVPSTPIVRAAAPLLPRTEGYALNRTQSTGGIAAKVSLELKKKYLLGESSVGGSIQKSGSASTLDSKFKLFRTNISDCQKLLKPAPEISASMQTFCNKLDERLSPVLSPTATSKSPVFGSNEEKKIPEVVDTTSKPLPPPDITKDAKETESEQRPRSPLHETSIIVPQIDWNKNKSESESSDTLSSECDSIEGDKLEKSPSVFFENIPRVEIHDTTGEIINDDMALDSLCVEEEPQSDLPKSINGEKKSLNQPKYLPGLEKTSILPAEHETLHATHKTETPEEQKVSSGRSTPSNDSGGEQATTALTETELSDWAHDGAVSDDFEDPDFELTHKKTNKTANIAELGEFDEISQLSAKQKRVKDLKNKSITEAFNSVLSSNLENIEFMDTGTETSSDDGGQETNNGYVELKNEEEIAEDSLSPQINGIAEAANLNVNTEDNKFGSECIDLKPTDLEKMKQNHNYENEEDSLLIVEAGTTTEENTCSDSTVKNVTEKLQENTEVSKLADVPPKKNTPEDNITYEEHCQRLMSKVEFGNVKDSIDIRKSRRKSKSESPPKPDLIQEEKERSSPVSKDITLQLTPTVRPPNMLYKKEEIEKERDLNQKLVQEMVMNKMKLQNKSLERKKRTRNAFSPSGSPSRPFDLSKSATTDIASQISSGSNTPNRNSTYSTSSSIYATPDVILPAKLSPLQKSQTATTVNELSQKSPDDFEIYSTPIAKELRPMRPLSVFSSYIEKSQRASNTEAFSLPDIKKAVKEEDLKTPIAPPRTKHEEAKRTVEKMKQNARARCRLLSNEELGLSPEDKLQKLREKVLKQEKENRSDNVDIHIQDSIESLVLNTERRNSLLYSNDTLKKKRNNSFQRSKSGEDATVEKKLELLEQKCSKPTRTKSVSELAKKSELKLSESPVQDDKTFLHKSDPNLLADNKKAKKKSKDLERRKSITKLFSTLFTKKKDASPNSGGSKGFLSRISPKSKDKSKSCINLDQKDAGVVVEEPVRGRSLTDLTAHFSDGNVSPPPIPPLPANYSTDKSVKDDSSDGEKNWRGDNRSSCDTLDKSATLDGSLSSLGSKKLKGARKAVRQAQLKRHRMAQEIQRKLEETEVKTRELEERGVGIEKALRGEVSEGYSKEESELLQEFFDLMRERTELRRYERELLVRAQELELEDRHARLQQELRERLENDEQKTKESLEIESSIIKEMMDIVSKRDSLIALLEEDRLRYSEEDRDFEEKMLAKGLNLTPIKKTPDK